MSKKAKTCKEKTKQRPMNERLKVLYLVVSYTSRTAFPDDEKKEDIGGLKQRS